MLEKIGSRQTKDRIADMLREEILSGRIADGEELAQEQLAELLEVSRMPVREALQILELEGLLLRLPNRHMRVVGLNEQRAYENLRLVAAVELEIALILIEKKPGETYVADVDDFHGWVSEQVENPYLGQIHKRLLSGYPSYSITHAASGKFAAQNKRICDAFNHEDRAGLEQAIRSYYEDMAQEIIDQCKGEPR